MHRVFKQHSIDEIIRVKEEVDQDMVNNSVKADVSIQRMTTSCTINKQSISQICAQQRLSLEGIQSADQEVKSE